MQTQSLNELTFRLISIEPLQQLKQQVQKIASEKGLLFSAGLPQKHSAPFCGYDLHCQEMTLNTADSCRSNEIKNSIAAIENLIEQYSADGYLEVLPS